MENKTARSVLIAFVSIVLVACAFGGGFVAGHFLPTQTQTLLPALVPTSTINSSQGGTPQDLQPLFSPFWEAWDIVHQQYVDQPVDNTKLMQGAIRGMMEALGDEHTGYMDPQEYKDANATMSGEYEGIGAWVDASGDFLTIISPMAGSPAEKAGILAGDKVIAVDGQDMTGINPELVRQKVLGPAGTSVHLTIHREGVEQPMEFDITRANIIIPSVESKMLDNKIAYIKLSIFGDRAASDFHNQLSALLEQKPVGLILDLRNNGGGYLDAAVAIGSEFIDHGVILYEQYGDGRKVAHDAIPDGLLTSGIPVVVLVNKGTASASEIVAGAIQDDGRGKLLGETTYGKGSVQNWIPLSNNEGAIRVTIARWLTPNEKTIDKKGLTPDITVTMTADDIKAGRDPQLDAAVKLLLNP